jgi:hypothetical protein
METTITGIVCLDMLQQFLIPQLHEDDQKGHIHFEQDGAPFRYLGEVRQCLSTRFPGPRIGRSEPTPSPSRCPDLTSLDFSYENSLKIEC